MERKNNASAEELLNPTKIIHYHKGDETYPKTDDLTKDNWSEYLFSDIYEKAVNLIYDVINMNVISRKNQNEIELNKINNTRNNIIAFVGERGSGKTSCLQSIYYNLNKIMEKNETKIVINNRLPIIDPSYFDDHSNILEIVVAQMFQKFKSTLSNTNQYVLCESKSYIERKRELITRFQQVKETLDCINTPNNIYASHDSIESLSRMSSSSDLESKMHELISCYLNYFAEIVSSPCEENKYNALVIAIDDLDVQAKHTYKMVEQIRKYLIQDNIVILLGVKLKQLSDLIKQNYYNDYRALLEKEHMSLNQIEDMSSRYLLKLIPFSHRLNLPNLHDNTNVKLNIYGSDNYGDAGNQTIYANILELIYAKTRISFYNSLEQESLIVPHNLRELLNLVALLCELETIDNIESDNISSDKVSDIRRQRIIYNRKVFKRYFIDTWCLDKLSTQHYVFIKELIDCDVVQFNKYIVDYLYKQYSDFYDNANNIDKNMFSQHNRSYNVSMADVQTMLDTLSTYNDIKVKRLVFAIKTIYSMFLYQEFHDMKTNQSVIDSKFSLVERLIGKQEKSWNANNKLNFLHNYERLLGGNVLNIYRKGFEKGRNLNREAYTGIVDGKQIWDLYELLSNTKCPKRNKQEKELYKAKFNVFEFFLLSILIENSLPQYRTFKHCYYDTFPINDFSKQELVFSFIAIPTNILRLYRLYQIYMTIGEKCDENIKNDKFYKFFKLIDSNQEISLIKKILQINLPATREKQDVFRNKTIEKLYINNIELVDLLENTIGFTSKERYSTSEINDLNKKYNDIKNELYDLANIRRKKSVNIHNMPDEVKFIYNLRINETITKYKETKSKIAEYPYKRKMYDIKLLKTFFEKLSTFQYYSYEFGIDKNVNNQTFITPLKDIMQIIADLFDVKNNSKFTDLFYEIYSYNPVNTN